MSYARVPGETAEARAYAEALLRDGLPPMLWVLDTLKGVPVKDYAHLPYMYISGLRPLPVGSSRWLPADAAVQLAAGGTRSVVFTAAPLSPAIVAQLELTPMMKRAIGAFFWAALSDGRKLELSVVGGETATLIFKNPRGIWQSSFFRMGEGPTGHIEAETPEELTADAVLGGRAKFANTGAVDAIMEWLT